MNKKYIVSLDQGTTSSRAVIYDSESRTVAGVKSKPLRQIYPHPGWVEHAPAEIYENQLQAFLEAVRDNSISMEEIACIGITNQRETIIVWDKNTGKPVHNAIVWQCRRTAPLCLQLKNEGLQESIHQKTGLVIDAYFSGTKIKWILDNVPGAREKARAGELLAGTVDSWLIWNLSGGKRHVTDYSNASRTMLFNIMKLEWDEEILKILGIPRYMLPEVVPSSGVIGETDAKVTGISIPISGAAGDQQASLFGQACFEPGSVKNTYGTGCFILMNTGEKPILSRNNLLTTLAWGIGGKVEYALEGSVFNAGSVIKWLVDDLKLFESPGQADACAEEVEDTGGVVFVPAFTGLGAPYWDMYARGTVIGLTRGTRREHLIRAALESIAYQTKDVCDVMAQDTGIACKELKVDGGVSRSPFLMRFQADMMNIRVRRCKELETTALGAAYLAGLGAGIWRDRSEISSICNDDDVFLPSMDEETRNIKYSRWKKAVERAAKWEEPVI